MQLEELEGDPLIVVGGQAEGWGSAWRGRPEKLTPGCWRIDIVRTAVKEKLASGESGESEPLMRPIQQMFALIRVVGFVTAVARTVRADTGVQLGVRGGIQLLDGELRQASAPSVGAEARFGFALSPLVVALTFDHFFVEDRTLYQIGANALYDLPIAIRRRRARSDEFRIAGRR